MILKKATYNKVLLFGNHHINKRCLDLEPLLELQKSLLLNIPLSCRQALGTSAVGREQDKDRDSDSDKEGEEEEEKVPVASVPKAISNIALTSLIASAFKHSYNKVQQSTLTNFLSKLCSSNKKPENRRGGLIKRQLQNKSSLINMYLFNLYKYSCRLHLECMLATTRRKQKEKKEEEDLQW